MKEILSEINGVVDDLNRVRRKIEIMRFAGDAPEDYLDKKLATAYDHICKALDQIM